MAEIFYHGEYGQRPAGFVDDGGHIHWDEIPDPDDMNPCPEAKEVVDAVYERIAREVGK